MNEQTADFRSDGGMKIAIKVFTGSVQSGFGLMTYLPCIPIDKTDSAADAATSTGVCVLSATAHT